MSDQLVAVGLKLLNTLSRDSAALLTGQKKKVVGHLFFIYFLSHVVFGSICSQVSLAVEFVKSQREDC